MTPSNQILLVMDAGSPVAAFTARRELQAYRRRFTKPASLYVYGKQGPSVMTMAAGGVLGSCK
jgi:hypothetical protein